MPYVDFKELKRSVRMLDVIEWLEIKLKPEGKTFRGPCPYCNSRDDRALVATPSEHIWYCHSEAVGGDTIALVAKHFGCSTRDAALKMKESCGNSEPVHRSTVTIPSTKPERPPVKGDVLQPLAHLKHEHEALTALGISPEACRALGVGCASKGLMRGRVAFPLRLPDGTLIGYAGLATTADQAPLMLLPSNLDQIIEGDKQTPESGLHNFLRVVR